MNNKIKHLEFIQAVINRMAGHSFILKGWGVTLVAALVALAVRTENLSYITVAYFPVLVFWLLDGYFLCQERLFRALYDEVRLKKEEEIDFSMDTERFSSEGNTWRKSFFSRTLLTFYLSLIILMLLLNAFLN